MSDQPNQTLLELFTREFFQCFEETFEKVQGIYLDRGTSLFETLDTISAEVASRPVSADCATIAAQVEHVRFYLNVLEDVMLHKTVGKVDWDAIWATVREVTPEQWETSKSELKDSYHRILNLMKSFETWEGENNIAGALAILVHTAYHLGEIRQALCTVKRR